MAEIAMGSASDRLTLRQIASELGDEMAQMLIQGFGGTRLYIPLEPGEESLLVRLLGPQAAYRLGHRFGGEAVDVPLHKSRADRRVDNEAILKLREDGHSVSAVARMVGCSERHVYYVMSRRNSPAEP